ITKNTIHLRQCHDCRWASKQFRRFSRTSRANAKEARVNSNSLRNPVLTPERRCQSIDEAPGWIVSSAQVPSYTLAIPCRKFRAWRIEQVDADALTRLAFPLSAARMIIKAHALIGPCPHVDNAEGRRPGRPPLGNHGIHDGNLISPHFSPIDPERAGEQQPSKLETHGANSATRLRCTEIFMLAQTGQFAFACGLGVAHDLPVVVLP